MSQTFGSINFGNIPVAASGGISVLGARQGVWNNGGFIELGNTNIGDTSTYITNERFIVINGGALWAIDLSNYGWRIQSNEVTILNDGEEWKFMQDGATRSVFRIESLKSERGIQWYNTGAPTSERAFVGWNQTAGGNLILRNNAAIANAGILIQSNGGGDINLSISGAQMLRVNYAGAASGTIYFPGSTTTANSLNANGGTVTIVGLTQLRLTAGGEKIRCSTTGIGFISPAGFGGSSSFSTSTWAQFAGSSSGISSMRILSGTAPAAPVDGDMWFDGADLFMQVAGVTKVFTLV